MILKFSLVLVFVKASLFFSTESVRPFMLESLLVDSINLQQCSILDGPFCLSNNKEFKLEQLHK